jgi:hypothetical protein
MENNILLQNNIHSVLIIWLKWENKIEKICKKKYSGDNLFIKFLGNSLENRIVVTIRDVFFSIYCFINNLFIIWLTLHQIMASVMMYLCNSNII